MSQKNSTITNYLLPQITKYKLAEEIGSGAYGVVYKGFREDDGRNVALKRIFVTDKDGNNNVPLSTHRELCALKRLNSYDNKNIVRLYDVVLNKIEGKMCMDLIFELGDYDLEKYLKKFNSSGDMPVSKIINLSKQLIGAINFMHSFCIIHRDLKPANILINKDGTDLKVTDFGLARILGFDASLTPVVVTLWYRSPEILLQRTYLTACDMWSAGCIIGEMIYGRPIFAGENEMSQIEKIVTRLGFEAINNWPDDNIIDGSSFIKTVDKSRSLDAVLKRVDASLIKLIKELLRFDPDARILSTEALPQLDNIDKIYAKQRENACVNCSVSGFRCSGADCEIDSQMMIVNSVVRNGLDDDFMGSQGSAANGMFIAGIDDELSIACYPHEQIEIEQADNSACSSPDDEHHYSSSTSCSETDSCEEYSPLIDPVQTVANQQKESDEVGGSFSSYRSQNNCSFSSYAPSPPTAADSTDDDHIVGPDKDIDDFKQFKENFIISDEPEISRVDAVTPELVGTDKGGTCGRHNGDFVGKVLGERINSTPFKEVNDRSRLISPIQIKRKDSYIRKRILNSEDSSDSENEVAHFSPIAVNGDNNRSNLSRHKSLRRRVSIQGPHIPAEKKLRNPLMRTSSVLIPPITENEECRDMSFGERSLSRALETIRSSQLSDRPKIVVRRRSQAKKM